MYEVISMLFTTMASVITLICLTANFRFFMRTDAETSKRENLSGFCNFVLKVDVFPGQVTPMVRIGNAVWHFQARD